MERNNGTTYKHTDKSRCKTHKQNECRRIAHCLKGRSMASLLMAGLLTVTQPVLMYAADVDLTAEVTDETVEGESPPIEDNLEWADDSSESMTSSEDDSVNINSDDNENDSVADFTDAPDFECDNNSEGSNENNMTEEMNSSLSWDGIIAECANQNISVHIQKEDSSEIGDTDILTVKSLNDDLKKEIENKAQSQKIGVSISSIWAFSLRRDDGNGVEKESNASYKIQIQMPDISIFQGTKLYHQKENGDVEEMSYLSGSAADNQQCIEFVSSGGLGNFLFANVVEEDLSVVDSESNDLTVIDDATANENMEQDLTVNDTDEADNTEHDLTINDTSSAENEEQKNNENAGEVAPIIIDDFNVTFVSGADKVNGKNVWSPSDPMLGHAFIYRVDYTMSGVFSTDVGAFKIEVPLHILKNKNGEWADNFNCPYSMRDTVSEKDNPDFVYEVDEENNKVIIYNYKPYPTGEAGYIEFAYETSEQTTAYLDMSSSTKVPAKVFATNEASTVTAESEADEVYVDTHATIAYTQKKKPKMYLKWDESWGEKPDDADDYLYLIWPIRSYINKNTAYYDFYLEDTFSDIGGSLVGYRFSGESGFSMVNHIDNQSSYGDRYDSVLTKYSKAQADKIIKDGANGYNIHNDIKAIVSPVDHVDEDTNAVSSYDWWYKAPVYTGVSGEFWSSKSGIYGDYSVVESSEDVSNYMLGEYESGEIEALPNLKYLVTSDGFPYEYTLSDDADGTVNDALNGLYGKKKVDYEVIDDGVYISSTKLSDKDYDISKVELLPLMKDATFNPATYKFEAKSITKYNNEDNIAVFIRTDNGWKQAATYDMNDKRYEDVNEKYVKNVNGRHMEFKKGIKALKYTCSNAYYYTRINFYPEISLLRTDNVFDILKDDPQKISVSNEMAFNVTQNGNKIFERTTMGTDYVQKVNRESEIKKDIVKTKNLKKESRFEVSWNVSFKEKYVDDEGLHYIYQKNGVFYDLLPLGSEFIGETLVVSESGVALTKGDYSYKLINNYKHSGRTLLKLVISAPTKNDYEVSYDTSHSYTSISDYGRNLLNSVVYESGNMRIGEGLPDDGGKITDKDILKDIDPDTDAEKFVYAEARYDVNFPVSAVTGLKKQIKNSTSKMYSYDEIVHRDETYNYQVRLTNDVSTKAKDIVFFDSIENFFQDIGQTTPTIKSDWKGSLVDVDVSQIVRKGAAPEVYLSKVPGLNPQDHNNLDERTSTGEFVWIEYDEFESKYGLDKATAIAIDASKSESGKDFILGEKESISFIMYMKAPDEDVSGAADPVTYNNIFVSRTAIKEIGNEMIDIPQFFHQDYTQAHYRISGDIELKKVDSTDSSNTVNGAIYKLYGTSDYGTMYDEERISNRAGQMMFYEVEKGTYKLKEVSCSADWQLDQTEYTVVVDTKGNVSVNGLTKEKDIFILADDPRCHADIIFQKTDCVTGGAVEGAVFRLTGTSEYNNEYTLYDTANKIGRVSFKNIELGTYELKEVDVPEGYIKDNESWTVKVDEAGKATIYDSKHKEIKYNNSNYYQIENEPYHSVRFLKSSTYGDNIYLEGAEFNLTGISDYGTSVNMTATSGKAEDGGLVVFEHLEPGTYILKETKAPAGHYLDENPHSVVVKRDGTFTIEGLEKVRFGEEGG